MDKTFQNNPSLIRYNIYFFFHSDVGVQDRLLKDWGRIAANFMRDQWICLSFLIKSLGVPESVEISRVSETLKAALGCGVEALSLLPSDLVLPVLTFMETVLPEVSLHQFRSNKVFRCNMLFSVLKSETEYSVWKSVFVIKFGDVLVSVTTF